MYLMSLMPTNSFKANDSSADNLKWLLCYFLIVLCNLLGSISRNIFEISSSLNTPGKYPIQVLPVFIRRLNRHWLCSSSPSLYCSGNFARDMSFRRGKLATEMASPSGTLQKARTANWPSIIESNADNGSLFLKHHRSKYLEEHGSVWSHFQLCK